MRILMLAQFYPKMIGGEERHVQDLAIHLTRRGHQVAVATVWHPGSPEFELDHGVRVYRIHGTAQRADWLYTEAARRHAPPFPDVELMLALRRVILAERPQIVHAHNWLVHSFLPLKAWSGAKLVMTLHDYSLVCARKSLMREGQVCAGSAPLKCLGCAFQYYGAVKAIPTLLGTYGMGAVARANVDMFIAVSQATARGNGFTDSALPYQIIPNFVPEVYPDDEDANKYLELLPREDFMLFVGDLSERKGIRVLLDAYAGLRGAPPLVLIGRRLAESPSAFPANVIALDKMPHSAVLRAWRRSMVGLAPSIWNEPFGIVVLEAMAAGRPVIAARIGGLADEVVDGETGLLVTPGNAASLREAMQRLIDNPALRRRMGQHAAERALDYHANAIVPRIEHVYEKLLAVNRVPDSIPLPGEEQNYVHVG